MSLPTVRLRRGISFQVNGEEVFRAGATMVPATGTTVTYTDLQGQTTTYTVDTVQWNVKELPTSSDPENLVEISDYFSEVIVNLDIV